MYVFVENNAWNMTGLLLQGKTPKTTTKKLCQNFFSGLNKFLLADNSFW